MSSSPVKKKKVTLRDGNKIPVFGLGTYLSAPNEVTNAVLAAWKCGIRHFDCAQFYRNEVEVGNALSRLSSLPQFRRDDIWLTSKAWNSSHHSPEWLEKALNQTLDDLGTDYIDLYLIHWPVNFATVKDEACPGRILLEPQRDCAMLLDNELSLVKTWRAMIDLQNKGKAKSIGVSNFSPKLLELLISTTGVVPAVNQVEAHPYLVQQELLDYCSAQNIHITAYMPFGGDAQRGAARVLGHPLVQEISRKIGRDQGQVLGSWGIKRGFSVIPKSVNPARIESNFQVFDLDNESYESLTDLGRESPTRFGGLPFKFEPAWRVNVFDSPEEQSADLLEPF